MEQATVEASFDMEHNRTAAIRSFELFCSNELSTDLFMFSIYSRGISFTDMAYIKKSDVKGRWLTYTTQVVNPSTSTVPLEQCHAGNCQPIFVNHRLSIPHPQIIQ